MQVTIEHRFNAKAAKLLKDSRIERRRVAVPKSLSTWISRSSFYNGYFLGPRKLSRSIDDQIRSAAETLDDFSVESLLNKIHLEHQKAPCHAVFVFFAICNQLADYILAHEISKPMVLWYNDDFGEDDREYPSQTMSFGFPRTDEDYYYLDVDSFSGSAFIGSLITYRA